jgi:hypothetical protein
LSQVLQRRQNHDSFRLYRVDVDAEPDLVDRFGIEEVPTLVVVAGSASARAWSHREAVVRSKSFSLSGFVSRRPRVA